MVDSSITDDQRRSFRRWLAAGFVGLVGASGGLVAVQAQASTIEIAASAAVGLALGGALVWYLSRLGRQFQRRA